MSFREHLRAAVASSPRWPTFDGRGPFVRLDTNESPFGLEPEELCAFQDELATLALNRYPEVSGHSLRVALADRLDVEPDEILLGSGSEELISVLASTFGRRDDGTPERVLIPDPTFNQYDVLARLHGAEPVLISLEADFSLDEARFAEAIERQRPALAFFASPNNPSGNRFDRDVLLRLAARLDAVFVVDEAYAEFDGQTLVPRLRSTPGLFVLRSFSKIGFAGLRLGALIGDAAAIAELDKVRLPWNVNAASLAFGRVLLRHPAWIERRIRAVVGARLDLVRRLELVPGLEVFPSEANFVLVRTPRSAEQVFRALVARGVLVKNVSDERLLRDCLRVTVGSAPENELVAAAFGQAVSS